MNTVSIPVKFAIYDTQYVFEDLGDKIKVTYPASKSLDKHGNDWVLTEKKETIDNPERISFIRRMMKNEEPFLRVKETGMEFTIAEVVFGAIDGKGWKLEDFE